MEPVRAVSEDQLESIFAASLRVLSETGIDFLHPTARRLWADAGADVDGDRVRLDPELVASLTATAPSDFTLHARNPDHDVHVGGDSVVFTSVASPPVRRRPGPRPPRGQPGGLRQPGPALARPQRGARLRRLPGRADRHPRLGPAPARHPVAADAQRQGPARLQPRRPAQHRLPGDGAHRPPGRRRDPGPASRRCTRSSTRARRCATTSRCSRGSCSTPRATSRSWSPPSPWPGRWRRSPSPARWSSRTPRPWPASRSPSW